MSVLSDLREGRAESHIAHLTDGAVVHVHMGASNYTICGNTIARPWKWAVINVDASNPTGTPEVIAILQQLITDHLDEKHQKAASDTATAIVRERK